VDFAHKLCDNSAIVKSAKTQPESVARIEPTSLESVSAPIADVVAELSAESTALGKALHPRTAASLAQLVRIMNAYYSNLIEGHNTRPRDIERALAGQFDADEGRRNLSSSPLFVQFPPASAEALFPRLFVTS
jgi:Fic family protein